MLTRIKIKCLAVVCLAAALGASCVSNINLADDGLPATDSILIGRWSRVEGARPADWLAYRVLTARNCKGLMQAGEEVYQFALGDETGLVAIQVPPELAQGGSAKFVVQCIHAAGQIQHTGQGEIGTFAIPAEAGAVLVMPAFKVVYAGSMDAITPLRMEQDQSSETVDTMLREFRAAYPAYAARDRVVLVKGAEAK